MEKPQSGYKKLLLWQEAKKLAILVYKLTELFPRNEEFGLKSQMRRAVVSTMSQIAEGWLRRSVKEKLHILEIAEGSLLELESQAELVIAIGYWKQNHFDEFDQQKSKVAGLLFLYKRKIQS